MKAHVLELLLIPFMRGLRILGLYPSSAFTLISTTKSKLLANTSLIKGIVRSAGS